jgi:hypothetical protein
MTGQILGGVPLADAVKSDPRNVPAEEFGCQLINNQRSPLGCD